MADTITEGGCYCGSVKYQIKGAPKNTSLCHCEDCRRVSAAPSVAWVTIGRSQFEITQGKPTELVSSPPVVRLFCAKCGTHLAYIHKDRNEDMDVTTCSLKNPESFAPRENSFIEGRLSWTPVEQSKELN